MTTPDRCSIEGCEKPVESSLIGEAFCRKHFISAAYARLDQYEEMRNGSILSLFDAEAARHFVRECTRRADEMEHNAKDLDNLDRAKLLHILLSTSDLGRQLRRSPRRTLSIPVRLSSDKIGGTWEENVETVLLSKYGASVRCNHSAKPGETLYLLRVDTGQKAEARVAWRQQLSKDDIRIGVEFVGIENFWGLNWEAGEEAPCA
jgi:hypothetical protein